MPKPPPQVTLQLRIELKDVTPAIWRRILVPTSVRLDRLAEMLLAGMGWTNSHLHCFEIGDERYGMQFDDVLDEDLDERSVTVLQALRGVDSFAFEYDFGDGWVYDVTIEAIVEGTVGLEHAVCLDGANACPPEDCGGLTASSTSSRHSPTPPTRSMTTTPTGTAGPRSIDRRSTSSAPMPRSRGSRHSPELLVTDLTSWRGAFRSIACSAWSQGWPRHSGDRGIEASRPSGRPVSFAP